MFFEKLTEFLCEYLSIPENLKDDSGNISRESVISTCFEVLIENDIFEKEELRKQALKDYNIIIPHYYFKGA